MKSTFSKHPFKGKPQQSVNCTSQQKLATFKRLLRFERDLKAASDVATAHRGAGDAVGAVIDKQPKR